VVLIPSDVAVCVNVDLHCNRVSRRDSGEIEPKHYIRGSVTLVFPSNFVFCQSVSVEVLSDVMSCSESVVTWERVNEDTFVSRSRETHVKDDVVIHVIKWIAR